MSLVSNNTTHALEWFAKEHQLPWRIQYGTSPEERGDHPAFRLVKDGARTVEPPEVIGETVEDAQSTITLAASMLKRKKRRT